MGFSRIFNLELGHLFIGSRILDGQVKYVRNGRKSSPMNKETYPSDRNGKDT